MSQKLTPMMKQYMEIKKKHQNEILFFRYRIALLCRIMSLCVIFL